MARLQKPSDQTGCRQLDPEAKPETMEMNELERAVPAERGGNINYLRKELAVAYSTIICLKHTIHAAATHNPAPFFFHRRGKCRWPQMQRYTSLPNFSVADSF